MAELTHLDKKRSLADNDGEAGVFDARGGGSEKRGLLSSALQLNRRRWEYAATVSAVLLVVMAVVIVVVVVLRRTEPRKQPPAVLPRMTLGDVFTSRYLPIMLNDVKWMPTSPRLYRLRPDIDGGDPGVFVEVLNASTSSEVRQWTELLKLPVEVNQSLLSVRSIRFSPDERFVLFATNETVGHHSSTANYFVVSVSAKSPDRYVPVADGRLIRYVRWSRTGAKLILVEDKSLDVISVISTIKEEDGNGLSIDDPVDLMRSTGAGRGVFLRGTADWLYAEEILNQEWAVWCSPNDTHLTYLETNESAVKSYEYVHFGSPENQYVGVRKIRYPKAGTKNPSVSLRAVVNPFSSNRVQLTLNPPQGSEDYLMQVHWLNDSHVSALWMERLQQNATIAVYAMPHGGDAVATFEWTAPVGWIENYPYKSADNGTVLLVRMPSSNAGRFVHLAKIRIMLGKVTADPMFITAGEWEIAGIQHVDESARIVLATGTVLGPSTRHLYQIPIDGLNISSPKCVTCDQGRSCVYNSIDISANADTLLWRCQGPGVPRVQLAALQKGGAATIFHILEDNHDFSAALSKVSLPKQEFLQIPVGDYALPAMRLLPPDASQPLPTLFYAYNGPLVQTVTAKHFMLTSYPFGIWHVFMASRHGVQVIIVDGRGTPFRGDVFGKAQYLRLGAPESHDQLAAGRYAIKHLNADPKKMAFWGWSYGGFLSSYIASSGTNVFGTCIAVAPVTDWRYYDTAYTERYMQLPARSGAFVYDQSSIVHRAQNFSSTNYLVIHGTSDDNVHFQNTAELVQALTENLFQFRMHFYTDKAHSLKGEYVQLHLFQLITNFLTDSFDLK